MSVNDAVDVSERTFFRYFANKEDLALSFGKDGYEALLAELATRPRAEEPLTALRNAFRESLLAAHMRHLHGPALSGHWNTR
jgi:AcrR family transcriptional regulator